MVAVKLSRGWMLVGIAVFVVICLVSYRHRFPYTVAAPINSQPELLPNSESVFVLRHQNNQSVESAVDSREWFEEVGRQDDPDTALLQRQSDEESDSIVLPEREIDQNVIEESEKSVTVKQEESDEEGMKREKSGVVDVWSLPRNSDEEEGLQPAGLPRFSRPVGIRHLRTKIPNLAQEAESGAVISAAAPELESETIIEDLLNPD